jgi:hypothetical protein
MQSSGKAGAVRNEDKARVLYYGTRKADKLVRCYQKDELRVFRVEVELHSSLLRRNNISTLDDFSYLPDVIYTKHLRFVDLDWRRLKQHLAKKLGDETDRVIVRARRRAASLRRLRRYFRKKGVVNVHRFLLPLALNEQVSRALNKWARDFKKESLWVDTE